MPTLKSNDYNREGAKRVSTIQNIVCLHQLNKEVSHLLEECVGVTYKIENSIVSKDIINLLDKLKSINDIVITKVTSLTTDLNCKTKVKRFILEENAAQNATARIITTPMTSGSNKRKESLPLLPDETEINNRVTCTDLVPYKKQKTHMISPEKTASPNISPSELVDASVVFPQPINGVNYTLCEAFNVYEKEFDGITVSKFILLAKRESPPLINCDRATFYRHYK